MHLPNQITCLDIGILFTLLMHCNLIMSYSIQYCLEKIFRDLRNQDTSGQNNHKNEIVLEFNFPQESVIKYIPFHWEFYVPWRRTKEGMVRKRLRCAENCGTQRNILRLDRDWLRIISKFSKLWKVSMKSSPIIVPTMSNYGIRKSVLTGEQII